MSFDLKILNGDLVVKNGDLDVVRDREKLVQDVLKICITPVNANPLQPWYGSLVNSTLIGNILPTDVTSNMATTQLRNAIENLKNLQVLQAQSLQPMTPGEQIAFINEISINRNKVDLRIFDVVVKVLDRTFNKTSITFKVP